MARYVQAFPSWRFISMNANISAPNGAPNRQMTEDILALTAGLGAGAGLMYLCDPDRGRRRRNRLMGGATGLLHRDTGSWMDRGKHLAGKALANKDLLKQVAGLAGGVAAAIRPKERITDEMLTTRVRSAINRIVKDSSAIRVQVKDAAVTLEGKLERAYHRQLKDAVRAVPGVKNIVNRITAPKSSSPALWLIMLAAGFAIVTTMASARAASRPV
jgi:hypothetical protein